MRLLLLAFTFGISYFAQAQDSLQLAHQKQLQQINTDVWEPFLQAYNTLDDSLFMTLHTKDLIRSIGGQQKQILNYDQYNALMTWLFDIRALNKTNGTLELSFYERIFGVETASMRGVYHYQETASDGNKSDFYGDFIVFLRKTDGIWKIVLDYDADITDETGPTRFAAGKKMGELH